MRRRFKQLAILSTALGLVAVLFFGFSLLVPVPLRPSQVTKENFDRVQEGMTEEQVEAILGPPGDYLSGHYSVFMHGIMFRRYWLGDEGFIIIHVGPEDDRHPFAAPWKLYYKEFFPVPRQTYGQRWLQYCFGISLKPD